MSKDKKPGKPAKPAEPAEEAEEAAAKPAAAKRAFVPPPKPHGGQFPDKFGKGGPKPNSPKGRIFRHQGR